MHIADLHLRGSDLEVKLDYLKAACLHAKSMGVGWILQSGDWADRPQIGDRAASVARIVGGFLNVVEEVSLPWIIIPGNHDEGAPDSPYAIETLRHRLIYIVTRPSAILIGGGRVAVFALPWVSRSRYAVSHKTSDDEAYHAYMEQIPQYFSGIETGNAYRILLGHCEMEGCINANGAVIPGSSHQYSQSSLQKANVNCITLGHIHFRQGYYAGAFMQLNHGEEGNPQGWMLIDTERDETRFYDIDAPRYISISPNQSPESQGVRPRDYVRVLAPPAPSVSVLRADAISPDTPLTELVRMWAERDGLSPDVSRIAMDIASSIAVTVPEGVAVSGSLSRIHSVSLRGIGPHKDTHIAFDGIGHDWWAVTGRNGAGKTMLLESIYATLYGQWPSQGRPSLLDTMSADVAEMEVDFSSAGERYLARRTIRRSGNRMVHEAALYRDGEPVAGPQLKSFQQCIESIVGSPDLLLGSVFLCQDGPDFISGSPSDRMAYMRRYLGLDRYDSMESTIKGLLSSKSSELSVLIQREEELNALLESIPSVETEIAAISSSLDELRESRQSLRNEYDCRLVKYNEVMAAVTAREELIQSIHSFQALTDSLRRQVEDITPLVERRDAVQADLAQVESSLEEARKEQSRLEEIQREKRILEKDLRSCSQCVSHLNLAGCRSTGYLPCPFIDDALQKQKDIVRIQSRLKELSSIELKSRIEDIQGLLIRQRNLTITLGQCNQASKELERCQARLQEIEENIDSFQKRLSDYPEITREDLSSLYRAMTETQSELDRLDSEIESKSAQLGALRGRLEEMNARASSLTDSLRQLPRLRCEVQALQSLQRAFSREGIPQWLISAALPGLQSILDDICEMDFGNRFHLSLATQAITKSGTIRETCSVLYRTADAVYDVRSCSGGEVACARAALSVALVLYRARHSSGSYRVCILDEPFAHQDQANVDATVNMLRRLGDQFSQIIVASHDDDLLQVFNNHIRL